MPVNEEQQSEVTESTSEESSTSKPMTKQSRAELKQLLHDLNLLIVKTALASIENSEFATKKYKKKVMRNQVKHTKKMLASLSDSEQYLLIEDLKSSHELTEQSTDEPKLIVPSTNLVTNSRK